MPRRTALLLACVAASTLALLGSLASPLVSPLGAQRPLAPVHHTTWGELQGLPPSELDKVLRTPDGYLWLGGKGPLVRFDGVRFTMFDGTTTAALASTVPGGLRPLLVDRNGTMWISRADGALVQYRDGAFRVAVRARGRGWEVNYLAQDGDGRFWAMCFTPHGLHRVEGDSLVPADVPSWVDRSKMLGVIADTGDGIWFGTRDDGVVHLTPRGAEHFANPQPPGHRGARPLLQSKDGSVWVFGNGLQTLRDGRWQVIRLPGGERITPPAATESADGAVWVATRGRGILRFKGADIEQFTERDGLSDAVSKAVLPDVEGNTWVVTDAGLDRLRRVPFTVIGPAEGLPFDSPHLIAPDASGALWALSAADLRMYRIDGGGVRSAAGPVTAASIRNPPGGRYFWGTPARHGGLWLFDQARGLVHGTPERAVAVGSRDLDATGFLGVVEDREGSLWIATGRARRLRRMSVRTGRSIEIPVAEDSSIVHALLEDAAGRIVLVRRDPPFLTILYHGRVVRSFGPRNGLARPVHDVVADGLDTLWAHDADRALVRIIGSRFSRVESAELSPLLTSRTVSLIPAGDRFFVATAAGIVSIPRAALHAAADGSAALPPLRRYTELDGLRTGRLTAINRSPAFRGADKRIWFSTPGGLTVFDERFAVPNTIAPRVHIEEVLATDQPLTLGSVVKVPAESERLEIRFTVTALRIPERVKLEFRLDGVDPAWRTADATRRVTYTQIRPRRYTFHVRAWNEDGVPAQNEAVIRLRVMPRWYQSWWFLVLAVLAGVGTIAASVGLALRARADRAAERLAARFEATLTERTRLAGELHDTLLQGFTGITLQLQALRGRILHSPDGVERELERVLTSADRTLREARSMVWDMRAPELNEHDLAAALDDAAQQALATHILGGGAPVSVSTTVTGERRRVSPTVEVTALRIGREAVTNTLRHARASRVDVAVSFQPSELRVTVVDDGVGFDVSQTNPAVGVGHWGLIGMEERARRAAGSLKVTSVAGTGTTIDLRLPVS